MFQPRTSSRHASYLALPGPSRSRASLSVGRKKKQEASLASWYRSHLECKHLHVIGIVPAALTPVNLWIACYKQPLLSNAGYGQLVRPVTMTQHDGNLRRSDLDRSLYHSRTKMDGTCLCGEINVTIPSGLKVGVCRMPLVSPRISLQKS